MAQYKRKKEHRTDYKSRLKLVSSGKNRIVIRKSNKHYMVQIIQFKPDGDHILLTVTSKELANNGWKGATSNTASAYLTGMLAGTKAKEKKIAEAVLDLGLIKSQKGGTIYAVLKGCIDAGMKIPHSKEIFPKEDRIKGTHTKNKGETFETVKKNILGK